MATKAPAIHLPGLNGLRAISAIAVVLSHTMLSVDRFAFGRFSDGTARGLDLATYGVIIFFTISGFLITYLLLQERAIHQRIDVKRFYIRRILRIWPLYYTYLFIALAITIYLGVRVSAGSLALYTLFSANIAWNTPYEITLLGHYWSLGMEEQFYLIWPWLLLWSGTRSLKFTAWMAAVLFCLKLLSAYVLIPHQIMLPANIISKISFQYMLIGCLGAMLWVARVAWFMRVFTAHWAQASAWCCIVLIAVNRFPVPSIIGNEVVSMIALALIMGQVTGKDRVAHLEHPVWDALGKLSYGTYVIHPLVILVLAASTHQWLALPLPIRYVSAYGGVLALTLAVAWLSYRYLESPILRIKQRFAVVKSDANMPPAHHDPDENEGIPEVTVGGILQHT